MDGWRNSEDFLNLTAPGISHPVPNGQPDVTRRGIGLTEIYGESGPGEVFCLDDFLGKSAARCAHASVSLHHDDRSGTIRAGKRL